MCNEHFCECINFVKIHELNHSRIQTPHEQLNIAAGFNNRCVISVGLMNPYQPCTPVQSYPYVPCPCIKTLDMLFPCQWPQCTVMFKTISFLNLRKSGYFFGFLDPFGTVQEE